MVTLNGYFVISNLLICSYHDLTIFLLIAEAEKCISLNYKSNQVHNRN